MKRKFPKFLIRDLFSFLMIVALMFLPLPGSARVSKSNRFSRPKISKQTIYEAEKLLDEQGYWIEKVDGIEDASTFHALVAFQKVTGRKRTGILTEAELEALREAIRPAPEVFIRVAHLEIDLKRQVLFLIASDGTVAKILPVCTGNDERYFHRGKWRIARTPRGVFRITRQIKGIRLAPLGLMPYPNYFTGGFAIHGSLLMALYPASHGCVRIPFFAARKFSEMVSVGMPVFIFEKPGEIKL